MSRMLWWELAKKAEEPTPAGEPEEPEKKEDEDEEEDEPKDDPEKAETVLV